jgi:hypothetical protein
MFQATSDDDENPFVSKLRNQFASVLQIDNLEERIKEREKIQKTNSTLLEKMEMAMKKKFLQEKNLVYGVGNEEKLVPKVRDQCQDILKRMKTKDQQKAGMSMIGQALKKQMDENKRMRQMKIDAHKAIFRQFEELKKNKMDSAKEEEIRAKIQSSLGGYLKSNLADKYKILKIQEESMEAMRNDKFLQRSLTNKVYEISYQTSVNQIFGYFINLCIILNTAILSTDQYPEREEVKQVSEISNLVFYLIFLGEMLIKLPAYGVKGYFSDRFNTFDAFIVLVSSIDIGLSTFLTSADGMEG